MRNKTLKKLRGGNSSNSFTISEERRPMQPNKVVYILTAPIPKQIRNAVKSTRVNRNKLIANFSNPRPVADLTLTFPGDEIMALLVPYLNEKLKETGQAPLDPATTVEINRLQNSITNIVAESREGALISEENLRTIFNNSLYTGNSKFINLNKPASVSGDIRKHFLQKGRGADLLKYVLQKLRTEIVEGIRASAVVLVPANTKLVSYYQRFGFIPVEGVLNVFDPEGKPYGNQTAKNDSKTGPVMYLRL